ncbi:hypothetical protein J4G33_05895 [Actinotalea sp. BY-33]|uniref:Uncharacterized protein n=1 Tax=Actinotalea soli TaxID=2819234 RepID=A0A939RVN9_9CELL|nr:hypothetical protein [Actinotalea soli]MBO1751331.1 hypothetical protein [Actinotalea soli]
MKRWQRVRVVVLNTVILLLGLAGIGWQVYRNLAQDVPYVWPPLIFNGVMVVVALGLLAYVLRTPAE